MAKTKAVLARVAYGIRGVDEVVVNQSTTLVKGAWTEISPTAAKKLVGFEHKGRQVVEFKDGDPDNGDSEDEGAEAEDAEQEDNS